MNKKRCPYCDSPITKRNGTRNGVQLYKCQACGKQFRGGEKMSDKELWFLYQERKQTASEIALQASVSRMTIHRKLKHLTIEWEQPSLQAISGYVHLDTTYWGRNWGVLLALDDATTKPLYFAFVKSETNDDYALAIKTIKANGYTIKGVVIDGRKGLMPLLSEYRIQMCQFHMKQIIMRYLTKNPRIKASASLLMIINKLHKLTRAEFEQEYERWKTEYENTIKKRSTSSATGKTRYTHKRLRSAMRSIDFFLPYLFTYQEPECEKMPNTNNKIEGIFTDLKKNLNNHSGLSEENRKRFINGFFLALEGNLQIKSSSEPKPTAASR